MSYKVAEIKQILDEAECLADNDTVCEALDKMASQITAKVGNALPLIYVVMNGGMIVAGQLLPRLNFPLETAYLHVTRYGNATQGNELEWQAYPSQNLENRTVLILDDVLDEGFTLNAIVNLLEARGAKSVLTGVLVHKVHDRKAYPGMRADFTGLDIEDRFLFGFGMDYRGYWRNAPGIYAVKGH